MNKKEYFDLIVRNEKLLKKIKIKGIIQRVFLFSMMILSTISLGVVIKDVYFSILEASYKPMVFDKWNTTLLMISGIGFLLCERYNPLEKIGKSKHDYNSQLFVLIELIINEIKINENLNLIIVELFQLLYNYILRIRDCKNSLYIFGNNEVDIQIDSLYEISARKTHRLFKYNKSELIKLFEILAEAYFSMNIKEDYLEELKKAGEIINVTNNIDLGNEIKSSWLSNFMGSNKLKRNLTYLTLTSLIMGISSTFIILKFPSSYIGIGINAIIIGFTFPLSIIIAFVSPILIDKWKQ